MGPTSVQRWLLLAGQSELVEDLLVHLSAAPNWYDLYKAYEVIKKLSGGLGPLKARSWCPPQQALSNFSHTANLYRHSPAHASRMASSSKPMELAEANDLIRTMACHVMGEQQA